MAQIVGYVKDNDGRVYKIEKYTAGFFSTTYYGILYKNGDEYAKDFASWDEAIRYLERRVGSVREF